MLGSEAGRALSQLETSRTEADYGEPSTTVDDAKDAISKAEQLVEVLERFLDSAQSSHGE
jgi:HAMP domain-containing protein